MYKVLIDKLAYGDKNIFLNTTVSFASFGLYFIKGENGAGKSSLFDIISGKNINFEGKYIVDDKEISKNKYDLFASQNISYVTQNPLIFDDMTVIENMLLPYQKKDIDKANKILEKLHLLKLAKEKSSVLSGGEKQRLALARALYDLKQLVILDEITSYLDKGNVDIVLNIIEELSENHIVIFASHEMLPENLIDLCTIYTVKNNNIILEQNHEILDKATLKFTIDKKPKYLSYLFSQIKDNKFHYLFLTIIFMIVYVLFFSFGSISDSTTDAGINNSTYVNYINNAPGILVDKSKIENVDFGDKVTYEYSSFAFTIDVSKINIPGSVCSGIISISSNESYDDRGFTLLKGTYPVNMNEVMISSLNYAFLVDKILNDNPSFTKEQAANYIFSDYDLLSKKIVGVYNSADSSSFEKRIQGAKSYDISNDARLSYGFKIESMFSVSGEDHSNYAILDAKMIADKSIVKIDMIDRIVLVYAKQTFFPTNIEASTGKYALKIFDAHNSWMMFEYVFLAGFAIAFLAISFGSVSKNKRVAILLRVSGESREKQIVTSCIPLCVICLIDLLVSSLITLGITGLINYSLNSTILDSSAKYCSFSWLSLLIMVPTIIFVNCLNYLVVSKRQSPKDLSKVLYEIKRK